MKYRKSAGYSVKLTAVVTKTLLHNDTEVHVHVIFQLVSTITGICIYHKRIPSLHIHACSNETLFYMLNTFGTVHPHHVLVEAKVVKSCSSIDSASYTRSILAA